MPAQLQFFDMEASTSLPEGYFPPIPVSTGPNWQPGDIRVYCVNWNDNTHVNNTWHGPPGYTTVNTQLQTAPSNPPQAYSRFGVSWRRLVAGDVDTFYNFSNTFGLTVWSSALFTVRGVDPGSTPAITTMQFFGPYTDSTLHPPATAVVSSVSVPAAGTTVIWLANQAMGNAPQSGVSLGIPPGWINLVATDGSGSTYDPYKVGNASIAVGKAFSSSGSTGSASFPMANSIGVYFTGATAFFKAAPDVSITAGNATATATATNATFSTSTAVTVTAGSASSTATVSTAFNPLEGFWLSDPLTLPGTPVTGSVVRWTASIPSAGSTVTVATSINNGASWDTATNNRPVPRLTEGDTATRNVLVRATLTRVAATDPPPKLSMLEMQVSTDTGVDEMVPIGHGMIDKVTVKAVGGSTGGGSSTGVAGSSGVTSKGGGQTGGGTSIKVHVTDLSRAIKRNQWQMPYTVTSGTNYGDAVVAMVKNRLPSQTEFSIASTARVTPVLVYGMDQGGDPWQDIQELAVAIGFEAYFDPKGVFVFRPVPDPRMGEPVWEFDEDFNPTVVEASRELSDEQTFNDVVVTGQSTSSSNPVSAESFDNDPSSPTYILGPYGRVTQRITFSQITDQDQAQDAADALLHNSLGAADTVTITTVPHPALEPGDVVKINVSNVKADGTYMINSMTTPLSPAEPQQLVCFRQSTNT